MAEGGENKNGRRIPLVGFAGPLTAIALGALAFVPRPGEGTDVSYTPSRVAYERVQPTQATSYATTYALQLKLRLLGNHINADGDWKGKTEAAYESFQQEAGIVGASLSQTLRALSAELRKKEKRTASLDLERHSKPVNPASRFVQEEVKPIAKDIGNLIGDIGHSIVHPFFGE